MKSIILLTISLFFLLISCNDSNRNLDKDLSQTDTITPKTKISVKKEYDKYGNLISIDSTYSYFYSNIKNDSILEKEIFDTFKRDFDTRFQSLDSVFMKDFFIESPYKASDFYTNDFFENHFKLHQERLKTIFKRMDSIKNRYYQKHKFQ